MKDAQGFSLIELMVAVAILAIVAGVAVPAYMGYLQQARRSEAMSFLNTVLSEQQKYRSQCEQYAETLTGAYNCASGDYNLGLSSDMTGEGFYKVSITEASTTGFTAQAVGQASQADDSVGGTDCSTLTLTLDGGQVTRTPTECWQ